MPHADQVVPCMCCTVHYQLTCPLSNPDNLFGIGLLAATEILLPDEAVPANPILFDRITSQLIKTTSRAIEARLDICARGYWSRQQDAFFDVRVIHPSTSVLSRGQCLAQMSRNESQKMRAYLQRVVNVERVAFTPLVFSTNGLCGRECLRAKNLVGSIVMHHSGLQYTLVMNH